MKLQQKILLTLLPISVLGVVVLGWWSYDYARSSLYDREFRFSEFVLDRVLRDVLTQKYELMDRAGVVEIPIFQRRYTEEIQQQILDVAADTGRDILIFDPDTLSLVMTSFPEEQSVRDLAWRRFLLEFIQPPPEGRFTQTINTEVSTELFIATHQPDWNWLTIVTYRDDGIQEELNQVRDVTILATLLVIIITIVAFQLISSRLIFTPVQRLTQAAQQIAVTRQETRIDLTSSDELGKLARHMEHMSREIEIAISQANMAADTKSAFLANMSHEIRTPMNGLLGMLELLHKTDLTPQQKSYMSVMQQSGAVLMSVINDILDISKLEVGRIDLDYQDLDLIALLRQMLELQNKPAQDRNNSLMFVTSLDQSEFWVRADSVRIQQCVQNLLSNAIKFTEGGSIVVRLDVHNASTERPDIQISVMDTGIGIPEGKMSQLFERFEQMDISTTRKYGGTGLGLSIVKQLMELMGGTVFVESEVGEGSTFSLKVSLQMAEKPSTAELKTPTVPAVIPAGVPSLVVAEPNRVNQVLIKGLADEAKVHVLMCRRAEEALDLLQNNPVDGVMLAEELEDMAGEDLIQVIRAKKARVDPSVPIIAILSGMSEGEGAASSISEADFQLECPLKQEDFTAVIDHIIVRKQRLLHSA